MNAQRTRINSRGRLIPSNYGITVATTGGAIVTCNGCGRQFDAYTIRWGNYAACRDYGRRYALNRARAQIHADKCQGRRRTS